MRKSRPEWGRIGRALKDPKQLFVCVQQDLETREGLARHQDAFLADEWVRDILNGPHAGTIWLKLHGTPIVVPDGLDPVEAYIEARRQFIYLTLREALRLYWRAEKQAEREAARAEREPPWAAESETDPLESVGVEDDDFSTVETLADLEALVEDAREGRIIGLLLAGYTQAEISDMLGVSPGRVSQLKKRLRERLDAALSE